MFAAVTKVNRPVASVLALLSICSAPQLASGKAFLEDHHASAAANNRSGTFRAAAEAVLGCRGESDIHDRHAAGGAAAHLSELELELRPLWQTVPKNKYGRVEWRMLRYVAHRYFTKQSALLVRGFEPAALSDDDGPSRLKAAQDSPLMDALIGGHQEQELGYTLHDAASMVATIEQLIFNSEDALLLIAYSVRGRSPTTSLSLDDLGTVLEVYLAFWIVSNGEDVKGLYHVAKNRSLLRRVLPSWDSVHEFGIGVLRSRLWQRRRTLRPGDGAMVMQGRFSFADAHDVVGEITRTFAPFWENQCQSIKSALQAIDTAGTGRVSLSRFYRARQEGEMRFGESEAYLRELGILEESNPMRGPQLLIPNYVQGISNCIVSSANYHICCVNECEEVLNDIEADVGGPLGTPEKILSSLVGRSSLDDEPPRISAQLRNQLRRLAETHGGQVPLHGRLFAQWLHYAFPQECIFPHKAGSTRAVSIHDLGDAAYSSENEIQRHASSAELEESAALEEERWMSQWSEEEELLADYSLHVRSGWGYSPIWAAVVFLAGLLVALSGRGFEEVTQLLGSMVPAGSELQGLGAKAHLV